MLNGIKTLSAAALIWSSAVMAPPVAARQPQETTHKRDESKNRDNLIKEVRHQLAMLPYGSAFDNLTYSVESDRVTLSGQVLRPTLKSDAEAAVKSLEGVALVINNIEVLPASPPDDELRREVFRAIYGDSALSRYGIQAVPAIHIIVKNGNVTLEGAVENESDQHLANLRASGVPNVIGVKNNLAVSRGKK